MSNETTAQEIEITEKDMIVSSTDKTGKIVYANDIFCDVAGYSRKDVIGKPHNMIRHPDMPKVVFKLLWQRVLNGEIIYAFVKNQSRNGDYYWVKAYVKPIIKNGEVVKITSYRKPLNSYAKEIISNLYEKLIEYEKTHSVDESMDFLLGYLGERNLTYDQFIDRLSLQKNIENIAIRNVDFNEQRNKHIVYKEFVISSVKSGQFDELNNMDNEVYDFDQWCKSVANESFVSDASWKNMMQSHSQFHASIEAYIQKAKNDSVVDSSLLSGLNNDLENMFSSLSVIRDKY